MLQHSMTDTLSETRLLKPIATHLFNDFDSLVNKIDEIRLQHEREAA